MRASPKPRSAILVLPVQGNIVKWKKGTLVFARYVKKVGWCLERQKRIPAGILKEGLPLMNEMIGVPKRALKFL